jgi:hypothetical protein
MIYRIKVIVWNRNVGYVTRFAKVDINPDEDFEDYIFNLLLDYFPLPSNTINEWKYITTEIFMKMCNQYPEGQFEMDALVELDHLRDNDDGDE